ncbi:MAG TPA: phage major capsid protein [Novosphingobium sp.]|nr:phage major capsid protein [Novosphingobium sp.]
MNDIAELLKQHTDGVELKFEEYKTLTAAMAARLDDVEQKSARGGGGWVIETPGRQFVSDEGVKGFLMAPGGGRRVGVETKATLTSAVTNAAGSVGDSVVASRDSALTLPRRSLFLRNLLPVIQVTSGSVEYPKVKTVNSAAATVAEGALKPDSDMQMELVTVPIRTIAHWMLASRQVLDDAPQLQGLIDSELLYGLALEEESQLLNGGGTGTDLNGIYTQATAFAAGSNTVTSPNKIDVILYAMLQGALSDLPPTAIVLHPSDWTSMRGIKDGQGKYLLGDPAAAVEPRLFGLPVVATQAQTAGSFLVGDFAGSAVLYDRWSARVELSTEDGDNFRKNLVTILAEERIGLAVKRTAGFIKGTFSGAITDLTS